MSHTRIKIRKPKIRPERFSHAGTYWNGQPCQARKVKVVVGDSGSFPQYWARPFVGQTRHAVEVSQSGQKFYLDNEDGSGWRKVTDGMGSPQWGHKGLDIERVVE